MKDKPRNKKSIFVVLILLICCAAYLAYDVADGATPVLSVLFPTGAVLLFCIYMSLKQLRSK